MRPRLTPQELHTIFAVRAGRQPVQVALKKLGGRDKSTVRRAWNIVGHLPCRDGEAEGIAKLAGYSATPRLVWQIGREYERWVAGRQSADDELARQAGLEERLAHHRALLACLEPMRRELPMWVAADLTIDDLATECRADTFLEPAELRWSVDAEGQVVRLFDEVPRELVQHLESGDATLKQLLARWATLGGNMIRLCYDLQCAIRAVVERQTGLEVLFTDGSGGPQLGLCKLFPQSIYWWALDRDWPVSYREVDHRAGLCLIGMVNDVPPSDNWRSLAWVSEGDQGRVQALHTELAASFGSRPLTQEIAQGAAELSGVVQELDDALSSVGVRGLLPGRCDGCSA